MVDKTFFFQRKKYYQVIQLAIKIVTVFVNIVGYIVKIKDKVPVQ